jgi:hypothetical protein
MLHTQLSVQAITVAQASHITLQEQRERLQKGFGCPDVIGDSGGLSARDAAMFSLQSVYFCSSVASNTCVSVCYFI